MEHRTSGERDGRSDKGCWIQDMEHGIDADASQSLKGNQKTMEQIKD